MSTEHTSGQESAATTKDARITTNYATDARGRTYTYYTCTRCGAEGTRRVDLVQHDCEAI